MNWLRSSACHTASCCVEVAFATVTDVETDEWRKSSASLTDSTCVEVQWRKSSASGPGGQCVEVGVWKKSTASGPHEDMCVEVAGGVDLQEILVRDSKDPDGPVLHFTPDEWTAWLVGVRNGEFDLP